MTIDNQKQAVNLRIQKSIALLILIIALGLIYFANILPHSIYGLNRNEIAVLILVIFVSFFILHYLRNHNYIYYSDTGNKLILRYFSLRPFEEKKNAIEFNKNELHNFEIKKTMPGINKSIIIYRKTTKGIAKYPPVSLTALSKTDQEKMMASLQRLIMANQAGA